MSAEENLNRFRVRHPPEIERIMRGILEEKSLVTLARKDGKEFLVTTLVRLDDTRRELHFAASADPRLNARLLDSDGLEISTLYDQVRVQFTSPKARAETLGDDIFFLLPMPSEILYFQRREYYRLPTSLTNPVFCHIPVGSETTEAIFLDISLGGGMLSLKSGPSLNEGALYTDCRLLLPGHPPYPISLTPMKTFTVPLPNGQSSRRACCKFTHLPRGIEETIQRFILHVERERRQRELSV